MRKKRFVVANAAFDETVARLAAYGEVVVNDSGRAWRADALLERCIDADALLAFMTESVDDAFLQACPRLRIVAGALKGHDNFDVEACTRRGVWMTVVPDLLTAPTAELAVGLMVGVARNLVAAQSRVREGAFEGWAPEFYGTGLDGSCVGLVGFGAVGQAIARRLQGFGCRLRFHDPAREGVTLGVPCEPEAVTLDALLERCDFVVLALPLSPGTVHLVDERFLARMRAGSFLINPARGSLVDEAAVARALRDGPVAGYAADAFALEDRALAGRPRRIDPDLLASPRTLLTPHIGSAVAPVRRAIERSAADSIIDWAEGRTPRGAVNAVAPPDAARC